MIWITMSIDVKMKFVHNFLLPTIIATTTKCGLISGTAEWRSFSCCDLRVVNLLSLSINWILMKMTKKYIVKKKKTAMRAFDMLGCRSMLLFGCVFAPNLRFFFFFFFSFSRKYLLITIFMFASRSERGQHRLQSWTVVYVRLWSEDDMETSSESAHCCVCAWLCLHDRISVYLLYVRHTVHFD